MLLQTIHQQPKPLAIMTGFKSSELESFNPDRDAITFFFIRSSGRLIKINVSDVLYVEALKDYVSIQTTGQRYIIHMTMKEMEQKLSSRHFVRVHRSYIIQLAKVESLSHSTILMEGADIKIPLGNSFRTDLFSRINFIGKNDKL